MNNISSKKKYLLSFIVFIICFFLGISLLYIERNILGISSTFHPDSAWYLNTYPAYSYLSFKISLIDNILNFLKYFHNGTFYSSLVSLFHELKALNIFNFGNGYRNLILLNIFICSVTSTLIFYHYLKYFHHKQKNFLFLLSLFIFFVLPYKMHLSVHILKESLIFFFLIIFILYQSKISLFFSLLFGTSLRFGFALYYLIFFNFKNLFKLNKLIYLFITLGIILLIYYFKIYEMRDYKENIIDSFFTLMRERHTNVMDGRNIDTIPHFMNNEIGFIFRSLLWPILFLSGGFIFFTEDIFFKLLGAEIIILQIITWISHKKLIINLGLVLFLIIISLWVTTFTSFYRYSYLAYLALFIKIIFENKTTK
jgi:hypothetical protein